LQRQAGKVISSAMIPDNPKVSDNTARQNSEEVKSLIIMIKLISTDLSALG